MASWQAGLTNLLLRRLVKPRLERQSDLSPARIRAVRRRGAFCARWLVRPLAGTRVQPVDEAGVRGEWVWAPEARSDRALLFVHGGGFIIGSPGVYRHLVSRLSRAAGCAVFSLDYRLAPEHPHPAALEDVATAWRWLEAPGSGVSRLALCGDSAGGNLVLAATLSRAGKNAPSPAAVLVMAPWSDLTLSGASLRDNARADPYIPVNLLEPVRDAYLQGADPGAPTASPLLGDFRGFPPLAIHVGAGEILRDDSVRLERVARSAGVDVSLEVWQGLPHVFQLFAPLVPEGRRSLEALGDFARRHLAKATPGTPSRGEARGLT